MFNIAKHLEEHGIKPSAQRIAIMNYLLQHKTHPTVEEIHADLLQQIPTLSKTTVYNTLRLFSEHNAVLTLNMDDKGSRYDGDVSNHIHFKCTKCGRVFDICVDQVPGSSNMFLDSLEGFLINETHVYYKGICRFCNENH